MRYFDTCTFSLEPSVPYAWQPIGENIEIFSRKSKRLNVVGFYNTDNQFQSYCFECNIDSSIIVACLDHFAQTIKKTTFLLLDNASTHVSEEFKENIPRWKKKGLIIKYLPPYSPELNLIEILWRFIKHYWLPFSAYLSFETLVKSVYKILRNIGITYNISFS